MSWDHVPPARSLAATAFTAWETLTRQALSVADPALQAMIEERIGVLFGTGGDAHEDAAHQKAAATAKSGCVEAVEQFIIDVSAMTDGQREAVSAELGAGAYPFFQTLYVADMNFRLTAALAQLFGQPAGGPEAPGQAPNGGDLWPALDRFLTDVALLNELDPVTTELIRLRGARAHDCRICQSRRNVSAVSGGADETTVDKIDFFEDSDLDERYKVALRLTDAFIWTPAGYPAELIQQVRATFTPAEAIEIVLDLVRNAANKVAVALQADQPVVASGVEYFDITADGTLAYGLKAPVSVPAG